MIPSTTTFPADLDTNDNLFLVHDSLRVRLVEDYIPGAVTIQVEGDTSRFPQSGFITLTEQCSELDKRAITFYYSSRTGITFDELQLVVGFTDAVKPKRITNVTQNVMAAHHNAIKDALIAIEQFIGVKGTTDAKPLGATLEGRLGFLRRLVLRPRAWFKADKLIGIVPLQVTFKDLSFRNPTSWQWNFGDNTLSTVSTIVFASTVVPSGISNVQVIDVDGGTIQKTYFSPGIFDVQLTVSNSFGTDTILIPKLINARIAAPDEAVFQWTPTANQTFSAFDSVSETFLFNHLLPGRINARTNTIIDLQVLQNGEQLLDPVISYEWKLSDDLNHFDSPFTTASFDIGGSYDIRLRVNTKFGAYRTTVLPNSVNIIEQRNLFMFIFDNLSETAITKNATAYEFGLLSESFKTNSRTTHPVTRDFNFLNSADVDYGREKREFLDNNGFSPRGTISSGNLGTGLVYWSEGGTSGSSLSTQKIGSIEYLAFTDVWNSLSFLEISRPWNWVSFNSPQAIYFMLGDVPSEYVLGSSPTYQLQQKINLTNLTESDVTFVSANYLNGAQELQTNVDPTGVAGNFSVYRSAWKDSAGYLLRNDGVGTFFRLKSFYTTQGILTEPFQFISKLQDIPGSPKLEGELLSLSSGVYFFTNNSEVALYSPTSGTWSVTSPTANSASFRSLQDSTISGFNEMSQTFIAASDGDHRAYLSFDYSPNVFIKFNESDLTFTALPSRPIGEQFVAGIF